MIPKKRLLDIFEVLSNIDNKNVDYYDNLSDEQKKAFAPIVIAQWMCCSKSEIQTILTNEFVNKYIYSLYKHPELLYKLMTCCSMGVRQFYKWNKVEKQTSNFPKSIELIKKCMSYSTKQAIAVLPLISSEEIILMAYDFGYQQNEIKILTKELKSK